MYNEIKRVIPKPVKQGIKHSRLYIRHHSRLENVYHCCVQKTASEWVRQLLRDRRVFRYSGLEVERDSDIPDEKNLYEKKFEDRALPRKIISPLYTDYRAYVDMPKAENSVAFFVMRDPRDIVVSWYYSARWSHSVVGNAPLKKIREELDGMSFSDGLFYSIRFLKEYGLFDAMLSWSKAASHDDSVLLLRYEELTGAEQSRYVRQLFQHCDIGMPPRVLSSLLSDLSFNQLSARERRDDGKPGHYRSGKAGDWKNHFGVEHVQLFEQETAGLVSQLGY